MNINFIIVISVVHSYPKIYKILFSRVSFYCRFVVYKILLNNTFKGKTHTFSMLELEENLLGLTKFYNLTNNVYSKIRCIYKTCSFKHPLTILLTSYSHGRHQCVTRLPLLITHCQCMLSGRVKW
jgi:hypothetical protein